MEIKQSEDKIVIGDIDEQDRVYVTILCEAMKVYAHRRGEYGGGFRRYGFCGACFFIKDRANRLWDAVNYRHMIEDRDAHDVINYAALALIMKREGNYGGEFWPGRD